MKILDIPQSGKRGLNVSQNSRNGQISRALVIPTNPRTDAQLRIRASCASVASKWSTLTQEQRDAWTAEANQHQSKARLGQSGPLTGFQLYAKINCSLLVIGGVKSRRRPQRRSSTSCRCPAWPSPTPPASSP